MGGIVSGSSVEVFFVPLEGNKRPRGVPRNKSLSPKEQYIPCPFFTRHLGFAPTQNCVKRRMKAMGFQYAGGTPRGREEESSERRRHRRYPVHAPVTFSWSVRNGVMRQSKGARNLPPVGASVSLSIQGLSAADRVSGHVNIMSVYLD